MTKFAYSIVFVRDMERSVGFYRDAVGLALRMQSPHWTEFDTGGTILALHLAAPGETPLVEPGQIPAGHCHVGFNVADIDALAARLEAAGAVVMSPVKLEDFGQRMGVWRDPDGLPIAVVETPKK